jgi:hypothetical protein
VERVIFVYSEARTLHKCHDWRCYLLRCTHNHFSGLGYLFDSGHSGFICSTSTVRVATQANSNKMVVIVQNKSSAGLSFLSLGNGLLSGLLILINTSILNWDKIVCCRKIPNQVREIPATSLTPFVSQLHSVWPITW